MSDDLTNKNFRALSNLSGSIIASELQKIKEHDDVSIEETSPNNMSKSWEIPNISAEYLSVSRSVDDTIKFLIEKAHPFLLPETVAVLVLRDIDFINRDSGEEGV